MDFQASNILLCLRYGIGDLVMELPLLDRLREVLPEAAITGLGAEPAVEILEGDDRLNEVVSIQHWGIRHLGDPADEQVGRQFTDWLVGRRFDLILDPSHAARVVKQVIYRRDIRILDCDPACLEVGLAQGWEGLLAVKQAARQGWGLEVPPSSAPAVRLHPEETDRARCFLEQEGLTRDVVAISPGASDDLKRWPTIHFARLCRYVVEDLGANVLVFGGPGEAKLLCELGEQTRDLARMHIVQNLHLRQVAALLAQCRLYLGNDSGSMHLAAAVGMPVAILFGPTVPHLYLPRWVRSQAVASGIACPYRPQRAFGHPRCILAGSCLIGTPCVQTIDPAQVYATVKEAYAQCLPEIRP
ncbi:MAG: glycosyltransferase family 9 protein [Planctomycetes bacterium]|nr:glycosyltransferase family 9 protein [Planctomycetota bacterium]